MDIFEHFGIAPTLFPDSGEVRRMYLQKCKENHPDFALGNSEAQAFALEQTSRNNEAYRILNDFDALLLYVLKKSGFTEQGNTLDPAFLGEMMDYNEVLMDLQMEPDAEQLMHLHKEIDILCTEREEALKELSARWNGQYSNTEILEQLKEEWLKRKYLLRLTETLSNIAAP